jgi:hypothetical protein
LEARGIQHDYLLARLQLAHRVGRGTTPLAGGMPSVKAPPKGFAVAVGVRRAGQAAAEAVRHLCSGAAAEEVSKTEAAQDSTPAP